MERIKLDIQKFAKKNSIEIEVAAKAKQAKEEVKELQKGIAIFKAEINAASAGIKKFGSNIASLKKAFDISNISKMSKQITNLGKSLYTNFLSKAIDTSEELNLFNVVFDNIEKNGKQTFSELGKQAIRFQNELNEAFGTNKKETMRYQGLFQAMGESAGLDETVAALMSENMTKLAYDLASLYNTTETRAAESLRAGVYAGQTKPLRAYGIDVTQTSFKPIMEELGLEKSVNELTQAEKEILRYISTLRQAKNAMGDFANTIESPANQLKVLKQQFYEMQAAIGNLFVGAFARILPYVNAIIMVIKELAKTIATLFGIRMKDYNSGITTYEEGLEDYSDGLGGIADSAGEASDAIKALKRQVLAFDQINNLTSPTPSSSSGGGGGAGGGIDGLIDESLLNALKDYENGMNLVRMRAVEIRDIIMEWLGFTKEINEETHETYFTYDTLGKTAQQIAREIGENLGNMLNYYTNQIDWEKLGSNLANGINVAFTFIHSFVETYDWKNLGTKIADFLNRAIKDTDFTTLGKVFTDKLRVLISSASGFLQTFDFAEFGRKLANFINGALENIPVDDLVAGINALADGLFTALGELMNNLDWGLLIEDIFKIIKDLDWKAKILLLAPVIATALKALFGSSIIKTVLTEIVTKLIVSATTGTVVSSAAAGAGAAAAGGAAAGAGAAAGGAAAGAGAGAAAAGGAGVLSTIGIGLGAVSGLYLDYKGVKEINGMIDNLEEGQPFYKDLVTETDNWLTVLIKGLGIANILSGSLGLKYKYIPELITAFVKSKLGLTKTNEEVIKSENKVIDVIQANAEQYYNVLLENDKQQRIYKASTEGNYEEIEKILKESADETAAHLRNSLVEQTKTVEELGPDLLEQWTILAYGSRDEYKKAIDELPDDTKDVIQQSTGVVVSATPTLVDEFIELGKKSEDSLITEIKKLPPDLQKEVIDKMKEKGAKVPKELQEGIDSEKKPKADVEVSSKEEVQTKVKNSTKDVTGNVSVGFSFPSASAVGQTVGSILGAAGSIVSWIFGKKDGGVFANGHWQPIQAYANGGVPGGGQLFMAREAGPELVGKIGRHTAVMNNNQIVDSVKAGVYEAVSAAMSNGGMGSVQIDLHTDEGVVVDRINKITRQTGECPINF